MTIVIILIIVIIALWLAFKIKNWIKLGSLILITGGVKTGKSTLSVKIAKRKHKAHVLGWRFKCIKCKLSGKAMPERPLLYSNVPLKIKGYTPLTMELLLRQKRFNYKSTVYIQEASLLADSMNCKNLNINYALLDLCKLIAHETQGGELIFDTQSIMDCHYAIKRSIATYLYVRWTFKWLPFVIIQQVQEKVFDEVNSMNIIEGDVDSIKYKYIITSKRIWKKFDRYCYSILTDNLDKEGKETEAKSLKANEILTLRGLNRYK